MQADRLVDTVRRQLDNTYAKTGKFDKRLNQRLKNIVAAENKAYSQRGMKRSTPMNKRIGTGRFANSNG